MVPGVPVSSGDFIIFAITYQLNRFFQISKIKVLRESFTHSMTLPSNTEIKINDFFLNSLIRLFRKNHFSFQYINYGIFPFYNLKNTYIRNEED